MLVKSKVMFLGKREGVTKEGNSYKQLKFLDKESNDTLTVYCNDLGKFEKMQPYTDNIDVEFNFYRDNQGKWRVGLANA